MANTLITEELQRKLELLDNENKMFAILIAIQDFTDHGVENGQFTLNEIYHDLDIALWVAYANNNIDDYEHYFDSVQRLKLVEEQAIGCGTWYYRYSVALIYIGCLEEALQYAEKGVQQEPNYPWGWLTLASLRSHFGDLIGALAANAQGLKLVPGDYEFLRQQQEINEGKTLEKMLNHFITEEDDQQLINGMLPEDVMQEKLTAISGIICNEKNLLEIKEILNVANWQGENHHADILYCTCRLTYGKSTLDCEFRMNEATLSKFSIAWITRLKTTLDALDEKSRHWLNAMAHLAIPAADLELRSIRIDRDQSISLRYYAKQSDISISVRLTADFNIDKNNQENYRPLLYAAEEFAAVEEHIMEYFGDFNYVMHEIVSPDIHVDIYVIEPTPERNYITLVTCGAGAYLMDLPDDVDSDRWSRTELLICLPPDWDIQSSEEIWYWPMRCLKSLARLPIRENTWIGVTHTISYHTPFAENVGFTGVILLEPQNNEPEAECCQLPNGEYVNFYQLFPLYTEELNYKLEYGTDALIDPMGDVSHVVDIDRPNTRAGFTLQKKQFALPAEEMKELLTDWQGADGCLATDRITVEGKKVGYMYRESPDDPEYPDSGWRFSAGDEDTAYMNDPSNFGVYTLNTLCNYDPDIIPLLQAPYGTAFYRDQDGVFHQQKLSSLLN